MSYLSKGIEVKWPGQFLDIQAMAELLEVDVDIAIEIKRGLYDDYNWTGKQSKTIDQLDVPEEVKEKIKALLWVPLPD